MTKKLKFKQTEIGMIPEDWEVDKLENHLIIKGRIGWKGLQISEYTDVGPFIVGGLQIRENSVVWEECAHVTEARYKESPEIMLRESDILMTKDGTIGKLAYIKSLPDKATVASHIHVIRKNSDKILPQFLFYFFKSPTFQNLVESKISGSVVPALTQKDINSTEFPLPPTPEQQSIAKILSDLDSKIELNQQMNKTLEAIGKAIFKHWFIDFEFPNEEGKPYKSSGGEMVYNEELGKEIPDGWEVGKLGDFISVERGLSYKGSGLSKEGIPMINLGNIAPNNHFRYEGLKFYSGDFKERNLVKPGDLIIANTDITQKREVLGSCLIVPTDLGNDKILFTHHIYAVRHKNAKEILPSHFLSYLFQNPQYRERAAGFATGTTVLALPEDAILNFYFAIPNERLMNKFDRIIRSVKNKNSNNIIENKNLSQIRDSLLPKLMSGKIRVPVQVN